MALELFKPFIFNKLEKRGYAQTIKAAKKMLTNVPMRFGIFSMRLSKSIPFSSTEPQHFTDWVFRPLSQS
jgi:DNA-directed RNA polymerase beta' subunit